MSDHFPNKEPWNLSYVSSLKTGNPDTLSEILVGLDTVGTGSNKRWCEWWYGKEPKLRLPIYGSLNELRDYGWACTRRVMTTTIVRELGPSDNDGKNRTPGAVHSGPDSMIIFIGCKDEDTFNGNNESALLAVTVDSTGNVINAPVDNGIIKGDCTDIYVVNESLIFVSTHSNNTNKSHLYSFKWTVADGFTQRYLITSDLSTSDDYVFHKITSDNNGYIFVNRYKESNGSGKITVYEYSVIGTLTWKKNFSFGVFLKNISYLKGYIIIGGNSSLKYLYSLKYNSNTNIINYVDQLANADVYDSVYLSVDEELGHIWVVKGDPLSSDPNGKTMCFSCDDDGNLSLLNDFSNVYAGTYGTYSPNLRLYVHWWNLFPYAKKIWGPNSDDPYKIVNINLNLSLEDNVPDSPNDWRINFIHFHRTYPKYLIVFAEGDPLIGKNHHYMIRYELT
jgi:hypothetical protein